MAAKQTAHSIEMAVTMVLKKEAHSTITYKICETTAKIHIKKHLGVQGRGVKHSIILFLTLMLHEDFLKKGKHEKFVSKIHVLSKITTPCDFSRVIKCLRSSYG